MLSASNTQYIPPLYWIKCQPDHPSEQGQVWQAKWLYNSASSLSTVFLCPEWIKKRRHNHQKQHILPFRRFANLDCSLPENYPIKSMYGVGELLNWFAQNMNGGTLLWWPNIKTGQTGKKTNEQLQWNHFLTYFVHATFAFLRISSKPRSISDCKGKAE